MVTGPSAVLSQGNDVCPAFKDRVEKEVKALDELTQSYEELNKKFEQSVQDDFTAQAEGLIDGLRRNEAVKLAFARKRLGQTLETKRAQVKALRQSYCPKCSEKGSPDIAGRCRRCPDDKSCAAD